MEDTKGFLLNSELFPQFILFPFSRFLYTVILTKVLEGYVKVGSCNLTLPCCHVKVTLCPCILTLLEAVKARAWYLNLQGAKGQVSIFSGFFPQEIQAKMRSRKVSY